MSDAKQPDHFRRIKPPPSIPGVGNDPIITGENRSGPPPKKWNPFVFALAVVGGMCLLAGGRLSPVGSIVGFVLLVAFCAWANRRG